MPPEPPDYAVVMTEDSVVWQRHGGKWYVALNRSIDASWDDLRAWNSHIRIVHPKRWYNMPTM